MIIKFYGDKIEENKKSIVLCGPTPRNNNVISWRVEAIEILKNTKFDGIVYIPEGQKFNTYAEQVEWELQAYKNSNVIVFWVPRQFPDMMGLTTNVEFGYWLKSGKCIYGRPNTAERIRYLDYMYEKEYGKKPINNLEELLLESVKLADIEVKK